MSWREYWNSDTPIYVNARHRQVHYQRIAEDIGRLLSGQNQRILDFGCGEALAADQLATRCAHLYLCDGADLVRRRLRERLGHLANVTVLAPEELDAVPDRSGRSDRRQLCGSVSEPRGACARSLRNGGASSRPRDGSSSPTCLPRQSEPGDGRDGAAALCGSATASCSLP